MTNIFKAHSDSHQNNPPILLSLIIILTLSLLLHVFSMASIDLLVEEAYYWNYAQHLDFSYLDHPPMVAVLIKLFTTVFGQHDFSVRLASFLCWFLAMFFSYKLTSLIQRNAGLYSVMLLSILPFFFCQTLFITPDLPLIACWSASLYFLYRALVLNEGNCWYLAGIWLGLGMLSKYTIVLLGLATLFYITTTPSARFWFKRKEPYIATLIAALVFSPVIYWNATHEWISFLFQSKRRFASTTSTDLHYLLTLVFLFITPLGVFGLWELLKKNIIDNAHDVSNAKRFMRIFILIPLIFFALFSLNHEINLNWIGPLFLALIPWLAMLMANNSLKRNFWLASAFFLLVCYGGVTLFALFNSSEVAQEKIFIKMVAWERLIKQFHQLAEQIESETQKAPIFIPLDNFPIGSELSFYQTKFLHQGTVKKVYPIFGAHIFGLESLMYRYWSEGIKLADRPLILISKELWRFDMPDINKLTNEQSKLKKIWSYGQGQGIKNIPFYYKVVIMKEAQPI